MPKLKVPKEYVMAGGIGAIMLGLLWKLRQKITNAEGGPTEEFDPSKPPVSPPDADPESNKKPPDPLAVGVPGKDPEIDALLEEMDAYFREAGIDTSKMSAYEVTLMRKTPSKAVAIPPRAYWGRMRRTLAEVVMPLRNQLGFKFRFGGYRPKDYNAAVGGASGSRHMYFEGVDIRPDPYTGENRRALALAGAQMWNAAPKSLKMGLGVYGKNTPSNIHVDTGYSRRRWRDAKHWTDKARRVS